MKKVLIITYYWPPAGGIGVLRCLKITKYLRNFGYEPVIYTVENPNYPFEDHSNFKDIPEGLEVIRGPIKEYEKVFKKITKKEKQSVNNIVFGTGKKSAFVKLSMWVRANFFIPDAKSNWIKPSIKVLSKYLAENKIDAIFSDGPPHTNTVIAQKIVEKFQIPWLSDYQDPWTQVDYYQKFPFTKRADKKHRQLEQLAFKFASKIVSASPSFSEDLEKIGAKNTGVIYYGYDEDDFKHIKVLPDEKFTLIHAGILSGDRLPENLIKVLAEIIDEDEDFKNSFQLKLLGSVEDETLRRIKLVLNKKNILLTGQVDRPEVLQQLMNTQLLLILVNKENSRGRIPGKIYEYFRARRPIISIGDTVGDVAVLIKETQSGKCFEYEETETLKQHIIEQFELFKNGKLVATKGEIEQFSNYNQTKKVAEYLDLITNGSN